MIRRDYVLRMIEEFARVLAKIRALKREEQWEKAAETVDEEFAGRIGVSSETLVKLSETELLALLIKTETTLAVREKTLMLCSLLKEAGQISAARGGLEQSRTLFLKGLHLLLDALGRGGPLEVREFVPTVEGFLAALGGEPLPLQTNALLMQYYEQTGQFGRAEDALFAMLETEPHNRVLVEFGISFYERLRARLDAHLEEGNLPRTEVEAGLTELKKRQPAQAV